MGSIRQIFPKSNERWLDDARIVWRYVPLKTLFLYLSGKIFIPSVEKLRQEDPFEGEHFFPTVWFNKALHDRYGKEHEKVFKWLEDQFTSADFEQNRRRTGMKLQPDANARSREKHYFDFLRKTRYAWCWFASNRESAAMWNSYGSGGVAISSTIGKIHTALSKTKYDFAFGQMRYVSVVNERTTDLVLENSEDSQLILEPHFLKRNEYKSENEVRFVTATSENEIDSGIFIKKIMPEEWIEEIRLWPKARSSEEAALKEVVKKFAPEIRCVKSDFMSRRPDATAISRIYMRDVIGISEENEWESGRDDIPDILKYP